MLGYRAGTSGHGRGQAEIRNKSENLNDPNSKHTSRICICRARNIVDFDTLPVYPSQYVLRFEVAAASSRDRTQMKRISRLEAAPTIISS